jgi:hypothetical protein
MPVRERRPRRAGSSPARPILWSRPGSHFREKPGLCAWRPWRAPVRQTPWRREPDSNHRSRVRKSGECQVPADQTRVGRTLTLGGGAESSLEGRDIELSVSPKDIRTSPMISARTARIDDNLGRGTDGSNPLPSSGESTANRCASTCRTPGCAARSRARGPASSARTLNRQTGVDQQPSSATPSCWGRGSPSRTGLRALPARPSRFHFP